MDAEADQVRKNTAPLPKTCGQGTCHMRERNMLQKKKWLLLTFYTTAGVMAMERTCGESGLPGRIVPVPRSITADCGLAWRCEPALRKQVEALADPDEVMGIYELEI